MPISSAELSIVLEVQDRASAQLQQVGQQVARLQQQVEGAQRSTRAGGGLLGGLSVGAGFAAAQRAFDAMGGVIGFVKDSVITLNSELERNVATFEQVTGSVDAARDVVAALRREAAVSPFSDREIFDAGRALITISERSTQSLLELVRVAEVLASIDPAQGFEGATEALREAQSGDFESLAKRFELSAQSIQRFKDSGVSNLQAVRAELERLGYGAALIDRLGRTFEGRLATVRSFGDELRQRLGAGIFERVGDFLGRITELISVYGDRIRAWADAVGEVLGGLAERLASTVVGPLLGLLERLAPGITELFQGALAQAPQQMERFAQATGQAAQSGETLEHRLGRIGVEAGRLQLDADRVRRSYDEQLEPLERQLRLLQQSGDLQRVQNALASNRATVERMRLEAERTALERAAGGATDPNAAGLTTRQRMIALALEERRLRLEELGIEEQRRPLAQSLQEQITRIQEEQRNALAPLERELAIRKDVVAQLQLERQQTELKRQEAEDAARNAQKTAWQTLGGAEALAEAKQRGEELAAEWLKGWEEWIKKGGGTIGGAIKKSLEDWWEATGRLAAIRIGAELGTAIGAATGLALQLTLGPQLKQLEALEKFVAGLEQRLQGLQRGVDQVTGAVGATGTALDATANTREAGGPFGPLGAPGVRQPLPRVNEPAPPDQGPNQLTGGGAVNVTIESGAVTVAGGATPEQLRKARDETIRLINEAFEAMAMGAASADNTAIGLQGAHRAP